MSNNHGGARPKSRPDDKRGGAGRGQGRKKSTHIIKLGQVLQIEVAQNDKPLIPPMPFDVEFCENGVILLTSEEYTIAIHV